MSPHQALSELGSLVPNYSRHYSKAKRFHLWPESQRVPSDFLILIQCPLSGALGDIRAAFAGVAFSLVSGHPLFAPRLLLMTHSGHRRVLERSPQFRLLFQI
jgi:hypothetical protein